MATTKKYVEYKKQPRKIPLEEEHALIKAAQEGNKKSAEKLILLYDFFITSLARRIAHQTGAVQHTEDLIQIGRLTLYEKIFSYRFHHTTRLTSYAYREIVHRMYQEACDLLEIIPLSKKFELHQAHKELDAAGFTEEAIQDVMDKYSLSRNVIMSLQRSTTSIDDHIDSIVNYTTPESTLLETELKEFGTSNSWIELNPMQRIILAVLYLSNSIRERTNIFGIKPKDLKLMEECAKTALYKNGKNE